MTGPPTPRSGIMDNNRIVQSVLQLAGSYCILRSHTVRDLKYHAHWPPVVFCAHAGELCTAVLGPRGKWKLYLLMMTLAGPFPWWSWTSKIRPCPAWQLAADHNSLPPGHEAVQPSIDGDVLLESSSLFILSLGCRVAIEIDPWQKGDHALGEEVGHADCLHYNRVMTP